MRVNCNNSQVTLCLLACTNLCVCLLLAWFTCKSHTQSTYTCECHTQVSATFSCIRYSRMCNSSQYAIYKDITNKSKFITKPEKISRVKAWYISQNRTELHRTISRNFLGINYGTEHSLVHLICHLKHPTICSASIAILTMSVNEISARIVFCASTKFLNNAYLICTYTHRVT